jgi:hypothetical protein
MNIRKGPRPLRHLCDGDVFTGPFDLGWADDGTRLWYPHVQVFAPMPGEAPAGQVVVRLLDDDFNPLGEQTWPAWWLTHVRGIRRRRSSVVRRGPRIA